MRFMLAVQNDWSVPLPTGAEWDESVARVEVVNDDMRAQGVWVFGGGLTDPDTATVVRIESGAVTMTDGPFIETKEQLGGFWVIDVADRAEALEWARRCAEACAAPIEVRSFDELSQG
ncbi:Uncharacterized conserved protein [Pseudonocardia thermophila]|uniref:Uncharacterized conserved protein n=2 Tax=Pseudonocardia thermophila TaxID=1848 RepID=A0A1M6U5R0_PSETH|nr:Uncharacterized conserved protein [Pseudonocardia thermophila]